MATPTIDALHRLEPESMADDQSATAAASTDAPAKGSPRHASTPALRAPRVVRLYFASVRFVERATTLAAAALVGGWLGVLSRDRLHAIDAAHYNRRRMYWTPAYNRRGLWDWERRAVTEHFEGRSRVLVAAAGGGREILSLRQLGWHALGFECHPGLVAVANVLLAEDGYPAAVRVAERDECPPFDAPFDAAIVGWGAYTHIRGRARRVAFLSAMRRQLAAGAPVLVSFWPVRMPTKDLRLVAKIANTLRRISGAERAEVGDYLGPMYVRFFTREDIAGEARDAGFDMESWAAEPYGHALLRAHG
jgi:hypothetical protein